MKKTILLFFICILMTITPANAMTLVYDGANHNYMGALYGLYVDGKAVTTPLQPIIFNNRALVPVREVFEAMGATVDYNNEKKSVTIKGNGTTITMVIGSSTAIINGVTKEFTDGVAPKLIARVGEYAKTMVPVRFISENLGYKVDFTGSDIKITTNSVITSPITSIVKIPILNEMYCKQSTDTVMISVKSSEAMTNVTNAVSTQSGVVYVDVKNVDCKLPDIISVNKGAVTSVRVGIHEDYVRIAVDTNNMKSYSSKLSSDKKTLMITIVKKSDQSNSTEKIVVIDAGHGGSDSGACREYGGETKKEKDINLAIAKKTVEILKSNGIKVEMTRTGDTFPTLYERPEFANSLNAAIFVSIHSNSATVETASGIEVFYSTQNNGSNYGITSKELADKLLSALITQTGANNRKVKTENHVVTRSSIMPAALVEVGFITNDEEMKNLLNADYQYKLASGIAEGIMKCLPKVSVPSGVVLNENDLGNKIA